MGFFAFWVFFLEESSENVNSSLDVSCSVTIIRKQDKIMQEQIEEEM